MEIEPVSHMGFCLDSNPPPGVLFLIKNSNSFESGGYENKLRLWNEAGIHITCQSVTVWDKTKENGGNEKPLYVFSLEVKTPEEKEIDNSHYQKHLEKNTYPFEEKVNEIKETLQKHNENKTTKIVFIESELKIVTDRIKYWFSEKSIGNRIFSAYEKKREIPNWKESSRSSVHTFVHSKYLIDLREYLDTTLLKLKNGDETILIEEEETEPGNWNLRQRYYLLYELDKIQDHLLKGNKISQKSKERIISIILSCDIRTARELLNQTRSYVFTNEDIEKIESFKNKINLE